MAPSKQQSKQSKGKEIVVELGEENPTNLVPEPGDGGTHPSPIPNEISQIRQVQDQLISTVAELSAKFELILQSRFEGVGNRMNLQDREGIGTSYIRTPTYGLDVNDQMQGIRRNLQREEPRIGGDLNQQGFHGMEMPSIPVGGRFQQEGIRRNLQREEPRIVGDLNQQGFHGMEMPSIPVGGRFQQDRSRTGGGDARQNVHEGWIPLGSLPWMQQRSQWIGQQPNALGLQQNRGQQIGFQQRQHHLHQQQQSQLLGQPPNAYGPQQNLGQQQQKRHILAVEESQVTCPSPSKKKAFKLDKFDFKFNGPGFGRNVSDVESMENGAMLDVVAVFFSISPYIAVLKNDGTEITRRSLQLKGMSGRSVELVLWGNLCNAEGQQLQDICEVGKSPVLAVTTARINVYQGKRNLGTRCNKKAINNGNGDHTGVTGATAFQEVVLGNEGLQLKLVMESKLGEFGSLLIGITAGGVGLDFSSAKTVVFVDLPKSASEMLQAEDRAHRRCQANAVNVYIFCAKNTSDEAHWQNLNRSLYRVSSRMNGKQNALRGIEVEKVCNLSQFLHLKTKSTTDGGYCSNKNGEQLPAIGISLSVAVSEPSKDEIDTSRETACHSSPSSHSQSETQLVGSQAVNNEVLTWSIFSDIRSMSASMLGDDNNVPVGYMTALENTAEINPHDLQFASLNGSQFPQQRYQQQQQPLHVPQEKELLFQQQQHLQQHLQQQAYEVGKMGNSLMVSRPPPSDAAIPVAAGKSTYVPPSLRGGADRSGADMVRRRNDENSVHVTNLAEDTHEPDLLEFFRPFGHVTRVFVAVDQKTGISRGFGFVNFQNKEHAERAIESNLQHKHECANQILQAAMAINSNSLAEMEISDSYLASLPKNGRASLGDVIYRYITSEQIYLECLRDCLDFSSEHQALEVGNHVEASVYVGAEEQSIDLLAVLIGLTQIRRGRG